MIEIEPRKLKGIIKIPPSKSLAHRAIICAALTKGKSKISNIEYSNDIIATIKALQAFGTAIDQYEDYVIVDGSTTFTSQQPIIDCYESGSTLRFCIPIGLVNQNQTHYIRRGNLKNRPLCVYNDIFKEQNIHSIDNDASKDLTISGKLLPGKFKVPGNVSSQFISGLLFALPLLDGDSVIEVTSTLESKAYIDLTIQMLHLYGITIINDHYQKFVIKGNQHYHPYDYVVESDFSQAAFFLVASIFGSDIEVQGLNESSLQADKMIIPLLKQMGANVLKTPRGLKMEASKLHAIEIDGSQFPDIVPVIALVCALSKGKSKIKNIKRLRIKECDRLHAIATQLLRLGAKIEELEDELRIEGVDCLHGGYVTSFNDHRIAMMLSIASIVSKKSIIIDNNHCVNKSYPTFYDDFKKLGGVVHEC